MSNSTLDAIYSATLDRLKDHQRNISDAEAGDVAFVLQGNKYDRDINDLVDEAFNAMEDELYDMTDSQHDREVKRLGSLAADSLMYIALKGARLLNVISADEERDLERAKRDFERMVSRGSSRNNRDRGRGRNGRDRDDNRRNQRNRNMRTERPGRNERDGDGERDLDLSDKRSRNRGGRNRNESEQTNNNVSSGLSDREIVTANNFLSLPQHLRDTPVYYAGLEKLIYEQENDNLSLVIFGENVKVDYEAHRTDLHLKANRTPMNVGKTIEELHNQLQKASQERVKTFIKDESVKEGVENTVETRRPITQPTVIEGLYLIDQNVYGSEDHIRSELAVLYGDKVNSFVYTVNVEHVLSELNPRVRGADKESILGEFNSMTVSLSQLVNLSSLRDWMTAASALMSDDEYERLATVINEVVCNALTLSLKTAVHTSSWLVDYDEIVKLIEDTKKDQINFDMLLMNSLTTIMPNLTIDDGVLKMVRTYIFLPFSKNEVVFASPNDYGVIAQNQRPQLFELLKAVQANLTSQGLRSWYTIVTSDNDSMTVRPVHTATSEAFYLFKPFK